MLEVKIHIELSEMPVLTKDGLNWLRKICVSLSHINKTEHEKYIINDPYFDEMLELVRYGFPKCYDWDPGENDVNYNFQHSINGYAYVDECFPFFACRSTSRVFSTLFYAGYA